MGSVVASSYPNLEVILADNASSDGSPEWVEKEYPHVTVLRHPENWGFCRGNNEAIRATESDYVVLLNNDVEVEPGWLEPLIEELELRPDVGAAQPKLLDRNHRNRFEYAGAAGGYIDRFGYPFARGRVFFTLEHDVGQYDEPADIFWATGAAMVLRRSALEQVGLLEEQFGFHMEEIDLCWRLQRAGYRIRCVPGSRVYHVGAASLPHAEPRKAYYNFRNNLLMLYRNLPPRTFRRTLLARAAFDTVAAVRAALMGQFRAAWAIARAYRDAHRMQELLPEPVRSFPYPESLPIYRGSIVWDYFVRRRKRFSDLEFDVRKR
jgi:GT2 family glycosyltransferase